MNVLSLFDGMSCGQIALNRANIKYDNYFASEIDKYAIKVTQKNYPNTIQLGDVTKWEEWNLPEIDLILAGSPCQGFSNSGLGLNFEDPRSKLFFTFYDIINYYKPKYWLLENVKMKKEWSNEITRFLGYIPVLINSALVSAQNRERLYWANFPITQPEDKGILLKDIIEYGEVDRDKAYVIDANYFKGGSEKTLIENYLDKSRRQVVKYQSQKRLMVRTITGLDKVKSDLVGAAFRNQVTKTGTESQLNLRDDLKSNCVVPSYPHKLNGVVKIEGKAPSLAAKSGGNLEPKVEVDDVHYRKLTVLECEKLQTVPEGYTEGVSNTQRYKMLGNGWTIEVITHILKGLNL